MFKKVISGVLTTLILLSQVGTSFAAQGNLIYDQSANFTSYDEKIIPYMYSPWYPTDDARITLGNSTVGLPAVSSDNSKTYMYNTLSLNTSGFSSFGGAGYTPGYAPQTYILFPKEFNGNFGDVDLQIKNLVYADNAWGKLKPVVTITFYDENNSPIIDSFYTSEAGATSHNKNDLFHPADFMTAGDDPMNAYYSTDGHPKDCAIFSSQANSWCRERDAKDIGSIQMGVYNMKLSLPLSEFSARTKPYNKDYEGELNGENIGLAKLKYIKIKVSLASMKDPTTNSSFLACGGLREDTLGGYVEKKLNDGQPILHPVTKESMPIETRWNNSLYSYGFTLNPYQNPNNSNKSYLDTVIKESTDSSGEETAQQLLDKGIIDTSSAQIFKNGSRFNINSLLTYFGDMPYPIDGSGKKLTTSFLINSARSIAPGDLQQDGTSKTQPGYRDTVGAQQVFGGILKEGEALRSRRLIQDQISNRITYQNKLFKQTQTYPSEVTVGGTKINLRVSWDDLSTKAAELSAISLTGINKTEIYFSPDSSPKGEVKYAGVIEQVGVPVNWNLWRDYKYVRDTLNTKFPNPTTSSNDFQHQKQILSTYIPRLNQKIADSNSIVEPVLKDIRSKNTSLSISSRKTALSNLTEYDLKGWFQTYDEYYLEPLTDTTISDYTIEAGSNVYEFKPLVMRGSFVLEDCTKLYILGQDTEAAKTKYWREETIDTSLGALDDIFKKVGTTPGVTYKPFSSGQGFGFTPSGTTGIRSSNSFYQLFNGLGSISYTMGIKYVLSPTYLSDDDKKLINDIGLPDFVGGNPVYDRSSLAPIINYYSVGSTTEGNFSMKTFQDQQKEMRDYCHKVSGVDTDTGEYLICLETLDPRFPNLYRKNKDYYFSLYDYGFKFDTFFNEDSKSRKDLENNYPGASGVKNFLSVSPTYYTDFSKVFNSMTLGREDGVVGRVMATPTRNSSQNQGGFFGSIPKTVKAENQNISNIKRDELIDQSFGWQTMYPFDSDLKSTNGISAATGIGSYGFNVTLPIGERYFKMGTYDLDKDVNAGQPLLDIDISIRPVMEDYVKLANDPNKFLYGPPVVTIDGPYNMDTVDYVNMNKGTHLGVTTGKDTFYDFSNGKWMTGNVNDFGGIGAFVTRTHNYTGMKSGKTSAATYLLPGPEGNNQTSFYKFDLYELKNQLETKWKTDNTGDEVYLKDWTFDTDTHRLTSNIKLRIVVKNPNRTSGGGVADNVLYFLSNGVSGAMPTQGKADVINTTVELMKSTKAITNVTDSGSDSGLGTFYYLSPQDTTGADTNIMKSTGTDAEKTDTVQFRVYTNVNDPKKPLGNPYLIVPKIENLEIQKFTASEVTDISSKINAVVQEKDLNFWENDQKLKEVSDLETQSGSTSYVHPNGKTYLKTCIGSEDTSEIYYNPAATSSTPQKLASVASGTKVDVNVDVPHQLVCFYRADGVTESQMRSDSTKRTLPSADPTGITDPEYKYDVLPFVDVYVKIKVQDTRIPVTKYFRPINIVKSISDDKGIPENYNTPYKTKAEILSNKSTILKKQTALKDKETLDKNLSFLYTSSNTTPADKRTNIQFVLWADKVGETAFKDIPEKDKIGNNTFNTSYMLDEKPCTTNCSDITVTWDYPKITLDNGDKLNPIPSDGYNHTPTQTSNLSDTVTVYPKVINNGRDICEMKFEPTDVTEVSPKNTGTNIMITSPSSEGIFDTLVDSKKLLKTNTVLWNGTILSTMTGKDIKYSYTLDGSNNQYSYTVKYKYCGDELLPAKVKQSPALNFNLGGSCGGDPYCGAVGLCDLKATTPAGRTDYNVLRGSMINYNITCTNNTGNDIYDLQVKLETPPNVNYVTGIGDKYVGLGSLPAGETISWQTNPLDLQKKGSVKDTTYINEKVVGILMSKYKEKESDDVYKEGGDWVRHIVITPPDDTTTVTVLRGPCSPTQSIESYPYTGDSATQQYPYDPIAGMCVTKIPSDPAVITKDNQACLVVKYYRLNKDEKVTNDPYNNTFPNLEFGNGIHIPGTTNNLTPQSRRGGCNGNEFSNASCINSNSISSGNDGIEGSVRAKYVNVKVNTDINIPKNLKLDPGSSAKAYTDYAGASTNTPIVVDKGSSTYNFSTSYTDTTGNTEGDVMSSPIQQVLKDGKYSNTTTLNKALLELRIPLLAADKGSDTTGTIKNFAGETVTDATQVKIVNAQVTFDRNRWLSKDTSVNCVPIPSTTSCSSGSGLSRRTRSATVWSWQKVNDYTTTDTIIPTTTGGNFALTSQTSLPVCVSSPGKWVQVLNGAMQVDNLLGMKDIEHQVSSSNPASYNTNWWVSQNDNSLMPSAFKQYDSGINNVFNTDQKYDLTDCAEYNPQLNEYNFASTTIVDNVTKKCEDGKRPRFYAITQGDYGRIFNFDKTQLQGLLTTGIDLGRTSPTTPDIRDTVWIYDQADPITDGKDLVLGKALVNKLVVKGMGSIFVTKDVSNLKNVDAPYDKTHPERFRALLNINSNVTYSSDTITTGEKATDITGDAMAIVVNGNMKIGSSVEKLEGVYFVNGDVIISESRNMLSIDNLYVTGNIYVERKSTTNSTIDVLTQSKDRPVLRVTGGMKRYMYLQPKVLLEPQGFSSIQQVEANDQLLDCKFHGNCN